MPGASFKSNSAAQQPLVTASVQINGQWKSYKGILDSGNDLNLITPQTAQQLGISPQMGQKQFQVQFGETANQRHNFFMINVPMKFGNLQPFQASIGVGPVRENLIGRKDVFEHHKIVFDQGKVQMYQANPNQNSFGVNFPANNTRNFQQMHQGSKYRGNFTPGNLL